MERYLTGFEVGRFFRVWTAENEMRGTTVLVRVLTHLSLNGLSAVINWLVAVLSTVVLFCKKTDSPFVRFREDLNHEHRLLELLAWMQDQGDGLADELTTEYMVVSLQFEVHN